MTEKRLPSSEFAGSGSLEAVEFAARQAWTCAGLSSVSRAIDDAAFAAWHVDEARTIEVAVDGNPEVGCWSSVSALSGLDSWMVRVLVPRSSLGLAHDHFRGDGHELQPWWIDDSGSVAFGTVELA